MKRKHLYLAAALALISGKADAKCQSPVADAPYITCASFTEKLLNSLQHATKDEVIKAMKAPGAERKDGDETSLHYASPQEYLGGEMNFVLGPDGRVVRIFGFAQSNEGEDKFGPTMHFIWNPDPTQIGKPFGNGAWTGGCSDIPGHVWPACNKGR